MRRHCFVANPVGLAERLVGLGLLLVLMGCVSTSYGSYNQQRESVPFVDRHVAFRIDRSFYREPPSCAVILRAKGAPSPQSAALVEDAVTRHLSLRLPQVMGRLERRRRSRALGIDLSNAEDRKTFANMTGCTATVEIALLASSSEYLVVWAHQAIGLEVILRRAHNDRELWRARHQGIRGDGGLPLSPVSVALTSFEATRFHLDDDVTASLTDDVVRRLIATLPDTR